MLKRHTTPCSRATRHHAQEPHDTMLKRHTKPCSRGTQKSRNNERNASKVPFSMPGSNTADFGNPKGGCAAVCFISTRWRPLIAEGWKFSWRSVITSLCGSRGSVAPLCLSSITGFFNLRPDVSLVWTLCESGKELASFVGLRWLLEEWPGFGAAAAAKGKKNRICSYTSLLMIILSNIYNKKYIYI